MKVGDRVRVRADLVLNEQWAHRRDKLVGVITATHSNGQDYQVTLDDVEACPYVYLDEDQLEIVQ